MNKRRSENEWFKIIEEFKASELNLTAWCKSKGISKSSIYPYIKKFNSQTTFPETKWVSVPFVNSTDSIMFTLRVGSIDLDIRKGFDKNELADILSVIVKPC